MLAKRSLNLRQWPHLAQLSSSSTSSIAARWLRVHVVHIGAGLVRRAPRDGHHLRRGQAHVERLVGTEAILVEAGDRGHQGVVESVAGRWEDEDGRVLFVRPPKV